MLDSLWPRGLLPTRFLCPWNSPGSNTGVGCHSLLKAIFPTQVSCIAGRFFTVWATRDFFDKYQKAWSMKEKEFFCLSECKGYKKQAVRSKLPLSCQHSPGFQHTACPAPGPSRASLREDSTQTRKTWWPYCFPWQSFSKTQTSISDTLPQDSVPRSWWP